MKVEIPFQELRKFHEKARKEMKELQKAVKELEKKRDVWLFEKTFVRFFSLCESELPLHVEYEEHALFPMMRTFFPEEPAKGYDETIADILNDHKDVYAAMEVIKLMKKLIGGEQSKDKPYIDEIISRSKKIISVMEDHFEKEEDAVYSAAEDMFNQQKMNELAARMARVKERWERKHSSR